MVDVDSRKWRELSLTARPPLSWIYRREAGRLEAFELEAANRAHTTLVVNHREAVVLRALAPLVRVEVVENGVDVAAFRPEAPPSNEPRVVFCGVLDYRPNIEAALWLMREIWPGVRAARPDARLALVGANPTRAIVRQAAQDASVELVGPVQDVRSCLWRSAVSVAPLRVARGVQNKVLEAIAAGLPAVVTPAVADGLPQAIIPACRVGSTAEEIATTLIDLLSLSADRRRTLAGTAALDELRWSAQLGSMSSILEDATRSAHQIIHAPSATAMAIPARMSPRRSARVACGTNLAGSPKP
jgi:glycosyltransferase involved in cell wall biosynthesis